MSGQISSASRGNPMSLHERLKRIEDRLAKLESTATEHAEFIAEVIETAP